MPAAPPAGRPKGAAPPRRYYDSAAFLSEDAESMAEALTLGLDAIRYTIETITENPFEPNHGIRASQRKLWKLVEKVVPKAYQQSDRMRLAKEEWDRAFEKVPNITQDILDFRATGETEKLVRAIDRIVVTGLHGCSRVFPQEAKYFVALGDLIGGIGESWKVFSAGDAGRAVQVIWDALKLSIDDVVSAASARTYKVVMGRIDDVVSVMNQLALEYRRRILTSKVCYKRSRPRSRVRPSRCREGFEWDQSTLCVPEGSGNGADCLLPCGNLAGLCTSFCGEDRACCKQGAPGPVECEGAGGFVDHPFTYGTSREYHQCVTPGPAVAFTVKGAGVPEVNGLYLQSGSHRGRPRYVSARAKNVIMEWSASREAWRLFIDDTLLGHGRPTLYLSRRPTHTFPTSGWVAKEGYVPTPTISPRLVEQGTSLHQANASEGLPWKYKPWHWGPRPYGTYEASCDLGSGYTEKSGEWCFKPCAKGFAPGLGSTCVQVCGGRFPTDGHGLCGTNHDELVLTMTEMTKMVVSGTMETYTLIGEIKGKGVETGMLSSTINVFVDMSKPFARPWCPLRR